MTEAITPYVPAPPPNTWLAISGSETWNSQARVPTTAIIRSGMSSAGVDADVAQPARICPGCFNAGLAGYSAAVLISISDSRTAPNETALSAKHRARPIAASTPPTAAPKTRAMFIATEFSVTALARFSGGTISEMNACRAGVSKTFTNAERDREQVDAPHAGSRGCR